jgi:hypothetical protein
MLFLLKHGIKETPSLDLSPLWNFGETYSHTVVAADRKKCFFGVYSDFMLSKIGCRMEDYSALLEDQISKMTRRGLVEKKYWENIKESILAYTKERAVGELIKSKKIDGRIQQIEQFIRSIRDD